MRTIHDFTKTLIRCSCIGEIMTQPKLVKDKEAGNLSKTAQSYLLRVYAEEKYGRRVDLQTRAIKKGLSVEEDAITLICLLDKKMYEKNDIRLNNDYFTGEPDIFEGKTIQKAKRIKDIKAAWDLNTFLPHVLGELNKDYEAQGQGYMSLTGASEFDVEYVLVNTPEILIQEEKRKLFWKMNVATEQNPDYLAACEELERSMRFDDIDPEERRVKFTVQRNDEVIEKAKEQVVKSREWLTNFQKKHLGI